MGEYNRPQQTPEIEQNGFLSNVMQHARNAYHAAVDKIEHYDYRRPMAAGSILALGGLAGGLKGETSLAQETAAGAPASPGAVMPTPWDVVRSERAKAVAENPDKKLVAPAEESLQYGMDFAAGWSSFDDLNRVTITRKAKNSKKLNVNLNLLNRRGAFPIAIFQSSGDIDGNRLKKYFVSFDGDMFTENKIVATPMLKRRKGGKPRNWGKSVVLPSRHTDPSRLSQIEVDHYTQSDERYTLGATITPKQFTKKMLKSGRLYVDVTMRCKMKDQSYDQDNDVCDQTFGRTFRVKPKRKTSYIPSKPSKPGDIYVYQKKVK